MLVSNLINSKGNAVKNQFVITDGNKTIFQSYDSKICEIDREKETITIFSDWNYSATTTKHFCYFLTKLYDDEFQIKSKDIEKMLNMGMSYNAAGYADYRVIERDC